jgi:hypothetical protein
MSKGVTMRPFPNSPLEILFRRRWPALFLGLAIVLSERASAQYQEGDVSMEISDAPCASGEAVDG